MLTILIVLASMAGFAIFAVAFTALMSWLVEDQPVRRAWWRLQDFARGESYERECWERLVDLCRLAAEETGFPASFWLSKDGKELSVTPDAHVYEAQIVIKRRSWAKLTAREKAVQAMGIEKSVRENQPIV